MDKKQVPNFMKKIKKINKEKLGKDLVVTKTELDRLIKGIEDKYVSKKDTYAANKEVKCQYKNSHTNS